MPTDDLSGKLHDLRQEYVQGELDINNVYPSPYQQFAIWFDDAVKKDIPEANAMVLSTVSADGRPSSRVVLLKEYSDRGFVFFSNYLSRKGREIALNPQACLNFWWGPLEKQIRIGGTLIKTDPAESDAYFYTRPPGSQAGAMISPQSEVINSREWLEQKFIEQQLKGKFTRPEHWGGYILQPDEFEFWQGRSNRLHDRIHYAADPSGSWLIQRLAP